MNELIKQIIEKHEIDLEPYKSLFIVDLNNAIIEICEAQKKECASGVPSQYGIKELVNNTKNIAE